MKKIITIEYEPGATPTCDECAFNKTKACHYLEVIGLDCDFVNLKDVKITDQ